MIGGKKLTMLPQLLQLLTSVLKSAHVVVQELPHKLSEQ